MTSEFVFLVLSWKEIIYNNNKVIVDFGLNFFTFLILTD